MGKREVKTKDFVVTFAKKYGLSKAEAKDIVYCVVDTLQEAIQKNDVVHLWRLGTFSKYMRKAHRFLHPQTGAECYSDANVAVKFHAGFNVGSMYLDAPDDENVATDDDEEVDCEDTEDKEVEE